MISIVVVQNGASPAAFQKTLSAARSIGVPQVIALAPQQLLAKAPDIIGIDTTQPLRNALAAALDKSTAGRVIILDARLAPENHELQLAIGAISKLRASDYVCVALQRGANLVALQNLSVENAVEYLASNPEWPLLCVGINKEAALQAAPLEGESLPEILARLLMKGLSRGQSVSSTSTLLPLRADHDSSLRLSGESSARILRTLVESNNIEDLHPNHPWELHEEESAAATYHALAALFTRFGDFDAAAECLKLGDRFENSPRSLALKGIIALNRGEMLGAVANMVASLQQYEMRKHDNDKHYVRFTPCNVEVISESMELGLKALNRQDNESALRFFSQAVFNFDPFFKETGLEFKS